jgi:hypothetical protein
LARKFCFCQAKYLPHCLNEKSTTPAKEWSIFHCKTKSRGRFLDCQPFVFWPIFEVAYATNLLEVANRLIRRFVPKGTKIESLTAADIKRIERWMNNYPRQLFGYRAANEIYKAT